MNGKTHELFALAITATLMHSEPTKNVVIGCLVAISASTLPDIDILDNSKGNGVGMVVEAIKQSTITIGFMAFYGCGINEIAIWMTLMMLMVIQPHRGFTHSIWCMAICTWMFGRFTDYKIATLFCTSYASHLLIDLLNTKPVDLLYPKGFCFKVMKTGGVAEDVIAMLCGLIFATITAFRMSGVDLVHEAMKAVKWT